VLGRIELVLASVGQTVFLQSPAAYTVLCVEQNIYDIFFLGCRQKKVLNIAKKWDAAVQQTRG
jgi:hypothetical protein